MQLDVGVQEALFSKDFASVTTYMSVVAVGKRSRWIYENSARFNVFFTILLSSSLPQIEATTLSNVNGVVAIFGAIFDCAEA